MLKLTKKGDKYWLFEDSEIGLFSPSKFTINLELNEIVIVYENGLKSKRYNVSDCEIYDLGELTPFTTSSGDLFMQKLEELNCPCFQKNENIFNISGGAWGDITGNLSDQTDLQNALDSKLDKSTTPSSVYTTDAGGLQVMKPLIEFKDVLEFANLAAFPVTGETGKIYLALDTNNTYRWSGSAYVQIGGGKTKYIIYKNFAINPMSNFTNWYRQISDIAAFTPNAGVTDTNAFSSDQNLFPQHPIPFAFKVKSINVNLRSNAGGTLTFDFAIRSFELPLGLLNDGLTTNSTNNKIVGRKIVQQLAGGSQPNYSFTGTEIDNTTILNANSHLKLYIKNNSGVSAGSFQGMVAITIEEV